MNLYIWKPLKHLFLSSAGTEKPATCQYYRWSSSYRDNYNLSSDCEYDDVSGALQIL